MSIGHWEPFWIGEPERQLYAALHRTSSPDARVGVLMVPPLLYEQPRSRRFVTEAASALAGLGLPTLRFDFFGAGDSAGSAAEMDMASTREDIAHAVKALRTRTGVSRIAVLAWRGGALAAWDWLHRGGDATPLVLWEPILDGAAWLADLERNDARERCSSTRYTFFAMRPSVADASDGQLMGYAVSPRMRDDLATLSLFTRPRPPVPVTVWMVERINEAVPTMARAKTFILPADAPRFGGSTSMDVALFMSPRMEQLIREIGQGLMESA